MIDPRRHPFLTAFLAAVLCIPGWAYAQRPFPIEQGILTSDLNGGNFSISNVTNMTATKFFGDGSALTNVTGTLPGNLVYTDVANQTITGNLTLNGTNRFTAEYTGNTSFAYLDVNSSNGVRLEYENTVSGNNTQITVEPTGIAINAFGGAAELWATNNTLTVAPNLSTTTGNLSLSGSNLTFDTGDIFMNGGDVRQVGGIKFGNSSTTVITDAPGILSLGNGGQMRFYPTYIQLYSGWNVYASTISANTTATSVFPYYYLIDTPNVMLNQSFNGLTIGCQFMVKNISTGNVTYRLTPQPGDAIVLDNVIGTVNVPADVILPPGMTIEVNYYKSGVNKQYINSKVYGDNTLTSFRKINHEVSSVSNGTITSTMHFVKVTATGNCTVPDGASGDWLTIKNYSGGVVTLVPTSDTIDGNATLSLNDKEAVDITSDGSIWMIH